jgi:hypothetical protein
MDVKQMFNLNKKSKILFVIATVALVFLIAVPYVAFAAPAAATDPIQGTRNLNGRGVAVLVVNGENVTAPANFTLTLERDGTSSPQIKFNVVGGSLDVNGTEYTIASGNGNVFRARHAILLQAQGAGSDGQSVTLKLAGRYFWMGGHLFMLRMAGSVETAGGKDLLLVRAQIRV